MTVQADRVRLYPRGLGVGVGRRGRTDTWIEARTDLIRPDQTALLWLLFSAEALREGGSVDLLLEESRRFAAGLADRLRERIYDRVIPRPAEGIAKARGLQRPTADDLRLTYAMALTVLFRLLFIAYAEDRDFLPFRAKEAYRTRALKTRAQQMYDRPDAPNVGDDLWREVTALFEAVRRGKPAWGVPAYNGRLFETDPAVSEPGAALAAISLPDAEFQPVLRALLLDSPRDLGSASAGPVDFRSLRVGEFGTIYEGLLESELALAEADLALKQEKGEFVYVPARARDRVAVRAGEIYLHNRSGARKASGSYFTPAFAVDHLLDAALEPALAAHEQRLKALDETDAAEGFFDLRIADIAMGSGHFLVAAIDRVERKFSAMLADRPLPGVVAELAALRATAETLLRELGQAGTQTIEDAQLLRRLIARRCIYGVDLNPLAVDLARLSVWIHTFVPALPLALLDHSLVQGNALVGIATIRQLEERFAASGTRLFPVDANVLLGDAAEPLRRLAKLADATLADIEAGRAAMEHARIAVAPTRALCDLVVAERMAPRTVRFQLDRWLEERATIQRHPARAKAREVLAGLDVFHFPVTFPEVFLRRRPGFDVIFGNPPWEKLRVEAHEFWARHFPGLRGIKDTAGRDRIIARHARSRPDLVQLHAKERKAGKAMRDALHDLPGMNTGHPDLIRAFMGRFLQLAARDAGRFGVVLPGDAFKIRGNEAVRGQLHAAASVVDVQMLTNRGERVFKGVHPQKTVALVAVEVGSGDGCRYIFRPEFHRREDFPVRTATLPVTRDGAWLRAYSDGLVQPTLPSADPSRAITIIEALMRAPHIGAHPTLKVRRVYADVETSRGSKQLYAVHGDEPDIWPVYGGDSFDIWQPDTGQYYARTTRRIVMPVVQAKRANARGDTPYARAPLPWRLDEARHPCLGPRIAYRDITNRTNTRTLIAALIPGERVLTQSAPWVLWIEPSRPLAQEAYLLGIMSSVPADWWMRCFVEGHVDEEAFNCLRVPDADVHDGLGARAVALAGRLACPDKRFAAWARAVGVEHGPLEPARKQAMIEELDAVVARLYGLSPDQLGHIFDTFRDWRSERDRADWSARRDRTVALLRGLC